MSITAKAAILGVATALAGLAVGLTPFGLLLEEEPGLIWLFRTRGAQPIPPEVIIVAIDHDSSRRLGLTNNPAEWPRRVHADLVRELARQHAAVIAFDIMFDKVRNADHERVFAREVQNAGNVVLFEYLKKETVNLRGADGGIIGKANIETPIKPVPELTLAAAGLAPFPLPKVPQRVSQWWLFKPEAGDAATLPVAAFQLYALPAYDAFVDLLRHLAPDKATRLPASARAVHDNSSIENLARQIRQIFQSDPQLSKRLASALKSGPVHQDPGVAKLLAAMIDLYGGSHSRYLNFYGPPRTIATLPYDRILQSDSPVNLKGKAVFVGFSERRQPDQRDGFYTAYTQPNGLDISGVEIAATAFANLVGRQSIEPLGAMRQILVISLWGFLLGAVLRNVPGFASIPCALGLCLAYFLGAYYAFVREAVWLPLAVPLLFQAPIAAVGAILWRYHDAQQERANIRRAFGYHLPPSVVDQLAKGVGDLSANGEVMYGICLATDAEHYTNLSEQQTPEQLRNLMNCYYQTVFEPIRQRGGVVSDVIGDASLTIWAAAAPNRQLRQRACLAALEVLDAVEEFNRCQPETRLPTRIGLHCGEIVMGHVGAIDHYEYRAVGDIVNTATRIEGLNKQLGTRLLASREVLEGVEDLVSREVGRFILAGKTRPLVIYEIAERSTESIVAAQRNRQFAHALQAFRDQRWDAAARAFNAIISAWGEDGPSRYYLALCEHYRAAPPPSAWQGIVSLGHK
jgi:adenylate cyclase